MKFIQSLIDYKIYAETVGSELHIEVRLKGKVASLIATSRKNVEIVNSPFSVKKTQDILDTVKRSIDNIYDKV